MNSFRINAIKKGLNKFSCLLFVMMALLMHTNYANASCEQNACILETEAQCIEETKQITSCKTGVTCKSETDSRGNKYRTCQGTSADEYQMEMMME